MQKTVYWIGNNEDPETGAHISTSLIQHVIDLCAAKGGGIVRFRPGRYLTGSIFVKSGVCLDIDKDVVLIGSQNIKDYPEIDTRVAGIEMKWPAALINIIGQHQACVEGEGAINAQAKPFWDLYWKTRKEYEKINMRWVVDWDVKRPRTILLYNSQDITLKGLSISQAGFWTVQVTYSHHVTIDGLTIRNNIDGTGPSTDGIDIDSSTFALVQNCDIDCNDDNFCLKAGRDWDGLRVNKPTEYVVFRHCVARKGAGLLTIGSETAGFIRHIYATDMTAYGTKNGFNMKAAATRGGGAEDITLTHVVMNDVGTAFQLSLYQNPSFTHNEYPAGIRADSLPAHWKTVLMRIEPISKGIPHFKDVHISDICVNNAQKIVNASGLQESPLCDFFFTRLIGTSVTAGDIKLVQNWHWSDNEITTGDGSKLSTN
ncbi:glycoside hydrolase family 28 protein [Mucilaginibacter rivuli]|uniref:glycoside hydrolase family 28 protein n=1 Tax=Mucilaginibacter rivuli TaxID=2857527 RepID=UPI0034E1FCE9